MKKVVLAVVVVGLVLGGGFRQAFAQDKKVEFSLNIGGMTDDSFRDWALTLSPQLDIHVTKGLMISPEAMVLTDFEGAAILPGVILNYTGGGFFAGGGVVVPISISWGWEVGHLLPKFNIGYRGNKVNLTVYVITDFEALFQYNLFGASVGYRF